MFKTLRDALKIKDIRKGLLFTFFMLIVVRLGSQLPVPGVSSDVFEQLFSGVGDAMNFFDAVTGGSFEQMSVFALNITPYITASIIMQLLTIAIPKLEELQRDGEDGRKKINKITRYVTVGLSLLESGAMAIGFSRGGYLEDNGALSIILLIAVLTGGSAVLMWIGEQITEHGVGNGISIVLIINIISRIPSDLATLYEQFMSGKTIPKQVLAGAVIAAIIIAVVVLVVVLQCAERKIPVQYSQKLQGRRQVGGNNTYIPLKVNTGGVIPVIFAQSIMQTPVIIATLLGKQSGTGIGYDILYSLSQSRWFDPEHWKYSVGAVVYILLIIAFAFFYTTISFNPLEIADNLKKRGGFVPGIRPGKPTSDYLTSVLNHIVLIGAIGLSFVSILPIVFNGLFNADVSFGGTSIIIVVGVIVETLKQIESQMLVRNYKGFLSE